MTHTFGMEDIGCYADGANGHKHCRAMLSALLTTHGAVVSDELLASLRGDMPDDCWDEYEALEALNELCTEDVCFEFYEGDLVLMPIETDEHRRPGEQSPEEAVAGYDHSKDWNET